MIEALEISTNKHKLDVKLIHQYLSEQSYWAKGRSMATVKSSIENSMCFGAYLGDRQVGFARVVTDYAVFGWILDVFIIDEFQNKGVGKRLISSIMAHASLSNLQRWGLNTQDAHELYKKYGFSALEDPEVHMELTHSPT